MARTSMQLSAPMTAAVYGPASRPLPLIALPLIAAGAGIGLAVLGCGPLPWMGAVGGIAVLVAAAWRSCGALALAAGIPALGLIDVVAHAGGPLSVLPWACTSLFAVWGGHAWLSRYRDRQRRHAHQRRWLLGARRDILKRTVRRYPELRDACLALSTVRTFDQLAEALVGEARRLLPDAVVVRVHLGIAAQLSCRAGFSSDAAVPAQCEPGTDERYVATEARALTHHERNSGAGLQERRWLLLPLRSDRRSEHGREAHCGVLVTAIPASETDGDLQVELLRSLALLGGVALATVDLVGQAQALALHDDLTGLFGQHEFLRRLDEQVASSRRHEHALAVVMCDLDDFKKYNDRWGHAAGDRALLALAEVLRRTAEHFPSAIACRYGGEEFALCLPDQRGDSLAAVAERLRIDIAALVPDAQHPERRITASIGVAELREAESGRAVLMRADAACYRAKDGGRNRVEHAHGIGPVAHGPTTSARAGSSASGRLVVR
jgi:diguanylate cyclase (GGDEF)-like protein